MLLDRDLAAFYFYLYVPLIESILLMSMYHLTSFHILKSKAHAWYEFTTISQYSILLFMFSLGMGLPSYNNYVGLCVFLFVKTNCNLHLLHITL